MNYIYALTDEDGRVLYVGKTNDLARRKSEHRQAGRAFAAMVVLEECGTDWREVEARWLRFYFEHGEARQNRTGAGAGCPEHAPEVRELLSTRSKEVWARKTEKQRRDHSEQTRRTALSLTPEMRAEANRKAWANATPASRKERGRRIAEGQTAAGINRDASHLGRSASLSFWASLTPEAKAEHCARREAIRQESFARKRANGERLLAPKRKRETAI